MSLTKAIYPDGPTVLAAAHLFLQQEMQYPIGTCENDVLTDEQYFERYRADMAGPILRWHNHDKGMWEYATVEKEKAYNEWQNKFSKG